MPGSVSLVGTVVIEGAGGVDGEMVLVRVAIGLLLPVVQLTKKSSIATRYEYL
jgi:hypothetical protein